MLNAVLSWPSPSSVDALKGARVFEGGARVRAPELAIARAVLRTNARITPIGALELACDTVRAARRAAIPPDFLGATLLQESAYDPRAISSAGAIGIAQFEPGTAEEYGVDPFAPADAIAGAARVLASYVRAYRDRFDDPYAAAYNAGPGAVAYYGGIPPYPETRAYITLIYERWMRIGSYERTGGDRRGAQKRSG